MNNRKSVYFRDIAIGATFRNNGNECTKKSTRTAYIDGNSRKLWFYFGTMECCTVTNKEITQ